MKYVSVKTPSIKITNAPAANVDYMTVVVGVLAFMFFLFITARGSLPKYASIFYG